MAEKYKITVHIAAAANELKQPISETVPVEVGAFCQIRPDVPATGKAAKIDLIPHTNGAPKFLLISSTFPDKTKVPQTVQASTPALEHATAVTPPNQRKPLDGTHDLFHGMSEWLTDSVTTGSLTSGEFERPIE